MSKEPVGSVAEEAAKLFAVLQKAAADARGPAKPEDPASPPVDDDLERTEPEPVVPEDHLHGIGRGPECQWCPICQLINRVRNTSPETIEQLSSAAAGVLGSVRSLLEAAADAARHARTDAESRTAAEQDQPARPRVDRIDVSEDPEPWD